jgi:hypothetical protein
MRFSEFFNQVILKEATFRKSKYVEHLADFPMFSVFVSKELLDKPHTPYNMEFFRDIKDDIQAVCLNARDQILKIGFPTMHANLVIDNLNDIQGAYTRNSGAAGQADPSRKYMKIHLNHMLKFDDSTVRVIAHEWAHLWMFNNSKAFKKSVEELYHQLLNPIKGKRENINNPDLIHLRELAAKTLQWPKVSGMSNHDELWATAIDSFFKLPRNMRNRIIKLMVQNR